MRRILIFCFILLLLSSISLSVIGLVNKEWETLTATISLTIAIISGWIAYEAFFRQSLSERPQIILRTDSKSRYGMILLVAENLGKKPAFNITLDWNQELLNCKNEKITFNKYDDNVEIPVLNPMENTSVIIDSQANFYKRYRDINLDFNGTINFQESLNSKKITSYPFSFSFRHQGLSPSFKDELPKTLYELQKLPKKMDEIKQVLINQKNNKSNL